MRSSIVVSILCVAGVASADPYLQAEDTKPPQPGVVTPIPDNNKSACGPAGYARTDRDLAPGRGQRVAGGMLVGLGLATLVPGAAILGWEERSYDPIHDTRVDNINAIKTSSAVATALGGVSILVGIPVLVAGVRNGKKAAYERVTFMPSLAPTIGGAQASLGGKF
jgi:hypothetical protein